VGSVFPDSRALPPTLEMAQKVVLQLSSFVCSCLLQTSHQISEDPEQKVSEVQTDSLGLQKERRPFSPGALHPGRECPSVSLEMICQGAMASEKSFVSPNWSWL
jgi:hypothetical protein